MRRLNLVLLLAFFTGSAATAQEGLIKVHQLTTGGGSQEFTYTATYASDPFTLTDGLINFSGNIPSSTSYTVTQTNIPTNWAVTDISCVCYQSNAPGNDPGAPCQSTWSTNTSSATATVNLSGDELVECTFVDTFTPPCSGPSCPSVCGNGIVEDPEQCDDGNTRSGDGCDSNCNFEGQLQIHQIAASTGSPAFHYDIQGIASNITLNDNDVYSSGFIQSFSPYTISQVNQAQGWVVTNITCVCSQLSTSPNDVNAACQSTWTTDIPHSKVNVILHGAEKVECSFVDTFEPCTHAACVASCGNGVVDPGEECDNGIANSDTTFGPGVCTNQCVLAPTASGCAQNALALYNACNQLPGRTSEVSVMLIILAALIFFKRKLYAQTK